MPSLPIVTIPYELYGLTDEEIEKTAETLVDDVIAVLTTPREKLIEEFKNKHGVEEIERKLSRPRAVDAYERVRAPSSLAEAIDIFYQRGWTDGLPIVPPTEEAVEEMLAHTDRSPDELIGKIPPRWGKATVEKIAVNAVMAGCLPQYFPILLAATEGLADLSFNLFALQATTNPVAPLAIINGPVTRELGMNSGFNAFGPGWRSNATIGRAIRLIMTNIGGGIPGTTDKAIQGQPAKYTFCIAENEAENPWEPLSVERGFDSGASTVTLVGVQAVHNFVAWASTPGSILSTVANGMSAMGTNNLFHAGTALVGMNPGHAAILARSGYSKEGVKKFLFDNARVPMARLHPDEVPHYQLRRPHLNWGVSDALITITDRWEDIMVVVVGAAGVHNVFMPTFGDPTLPVTKPITLKDGTPVSSVEQFRQARK
ncbi:MAG: hypothetical protein ABIH46_06420 [Chloroflexota bacterium]